MVEECNLFVLDFETTGLNPYLHDIIEVAIKKLTTNDYYQTLVRPSKLEPGIVRYIPPHITNITNITDTMIENESIEPEDAINNMMEYIQKRTKRGPIYIISHNGTTFDFIILRRLMKKYGVSKRLMNRLRYIDTILLSKLFIKEGRFRQKDLCKRYSIENENEHRALSDVNTLERIYIELCREYSKEQRKEESEYYINNPNEIEHNL
ncbi:MAG: hypothetical protein CL470_05970 [Acidimicrobiaceae bacterium]|nr:hypothetical protein [Acidimicrobiaceae bacterium]|tara:strand:- start:627 stop:1250 length:624 start_codon:yes stop_codon:yes gene_type:complete